MGMSELALDDDSDRPPQNHGLSRDFESGETRNRTGDTTIFSRVLYQLSYLAVARRC
jgi:hypothetical protein